MFDKILCVINFQMFAILPILLIVTMAAMIKVLANCISKVMVCRSLMIDDFTEYFNGGNTNSVLVARR